MKLKVLCLCLLLFVLFSLASGCSALWTESGDPTPINDAIKNTVEAGSTAATSTATPWGLLVGGLGTLFSIVIGVANNIMKNKALAKSKAIFGVARAAIDAIPAEKKEEVLNMIRARLVGQDPGFVTQYKEAVVESRK